MGEIIPLAFGAVIGVAVQWIRSPRLRAAVLVILCLIFGALASFIRFHLMKKFNQLFPY